MKGFKHFFTVPPLASRRLTIRAIGLQEGMPPGVINRPRGTGDYLFMYFYDPVWIAASELPGRCPGGTLMIWTPGRWQYYGDRNAGFRHSWIHCDGAIIRSLLAEQSLPLDEPMRIIDPAIIERPLLALYEELTRQSRPDVMIARNLLDNMIRETARAIRPVDAKRAIPESMLAVRHLLESEYERKLPLKELADRAGHSPSYFCEMFRKYFGTSPHEYLLRHRLHRAAYLLRDQNVAVKQVARRVGYRDVYWFSRAFKKYFGTVPSSFRLQEPEAAPNAPVEAGEAADTVS